MAAEEVLKSKTLYKMLLYSLKVIPILLALITLVNIITSYFDIDLPILSYLVTGLLIGFVYMAAEVFRFCNYHKMFLHYVTLNMLLNIVDYEIGLPIDNWTLFCVYIAITGISLFIILYMYLNRKK